MSEQSAAPEKPVDERLKNIVLSERQPASGVKPLKALLPFVLHYPVRLGLTALFLLVAAIASLTIPSLIGNIIDEGFVAQNLDVINQYSFVIIAIAGVLAFLLIFILLIVAVRAAGRSARMTEPLANQMGMLGQRVQLLSDGQQQLAGGLNHVSEAQAASH